MAGLFQRVTIATFSCLFAVACSSQDYRYVPSERQATGIDGKGLDAVYYEPAQAPSGTVRVLSMGVVDVRQNEDAGTFPALHLRMSIANQSEKNIWKLNSGDQLILLPNESALSPTFVNSDSNSMPTLEIKPGEVKTLDFYYRLDGKASEKNLSEFNFSWKIFTANSPILETTHFSRVTVPPRTVVVYPDTHGPYAYPLPQYPYSYPLGWGPAWWGGGGVTVSSR